MERRPRFAPATGRKTASRQGPRLLKKAVIAREIRRRLDARLKRAELSASATLEELRRVAFSDLGECFDEQGRLQAASHTLPPEVRSFLSSVKVVRKNLVVGDGSQEWVCEIKLWDKLRALEILAKHFALLVDRVQVEEPYAEQVKHLSDEQLHELVELGNKAHAILGAVASAVDAAAPEGRGRLGRGG